MGWFRRSRGYDRARIMRQAAGARRRRKRGKALELYRQVLAKEPENADVLRRVAALLAETKQPAESWATYRRAVAGLQQRGFVDQAVGVLREACASLPHETEVWTTLADFELERGRPIDAHKTLVDASHRFRGRRHRSQAILLLLRARKLDPHHFAANFELAGLLSGAGARERALRLLDELARAARGGRLRRVRMRQLALQPTPAAAWRWLRAAFAGS
jgi:thioredoxin-like negative regulator of GroEL